MFERFSGRARQVVGFAQEEARALKHDAIGTEHLLLGLVREEEGIAARVLASFGMQLEDARARVAALAGPRKDGAGGQLPFTPQAKKVLELSLREALSMGHNVIGTEHVLLGLLREHEGVAARVLRDVAGDLDGVRDAVLVHFSRPVPGSLRRVGRRSRRWSYQVAALPDGPPTEEWLAPFGADGWELVAVVERSAVFKRPA